MDVASAAAELEELELCREMEPSLLRERDSIVCEPVEERIESPQQQQRRQGRGRTSEGSAVSPGAASGRPAAGAASSGGDDHLGAESFDHSTYRFGVYSLDFRNRTPTAPACADGRASSTAAGAARHRCVAARAHTPSLRQREADALWVPPPTAQSLSAHCGTSESKWGAGQG